MSAWLSWTEQLPEKWKAVPLRAAADFSVSSVNKIPVDGELPVRLCNYTDVYNHEFITPELEFMRCTATPAEIQRFHLEVGDVPITKDSESWDDIGIPALVARTADDLVCGYHLALLRPRPKQLDGRFLFRCLQVKTIRIHLELVANGVTRFGIPKDEIGKLPLPLPPSVSEQRTIADFLDRETARLDALVTAKERWLELLAEKRRALITRAVTHGLNSKAPLRQSSLSWLGQIPKHWEEVRLKFISEIYYGLSQPPEYQSEGLPLLRATNVKRGLIAEEGLVFVDEADLPKSKAIHLRAGDIIVVRSGAYTGDSAIVTPKWVGAIAGYDMVLRLIKRGLPEFVSLALLCQYVLEAQIDPLRVRAAQPHLNAEELGDVMVVLPPINEQRAIVVYITAEAAKLDALRAATEQTIALLKERRAALIAAAVTGKIKIRRTS